MNVTKIIEKINNNKELLVAYYYERDKILNSDNFVEKDFEEITKKIDRMEDDITKLEKQLQFGYNNDVKKTIDNININNNVSKIDKQVSLNHIKNNNEKVINTTCENSRNDDKIISSNILLIKMEELIDEYYKRINLVNENIIDKNIKLNIKMQLNQILSKIDFIKMNYKDINIKE